MAKGLVKKRLGEAFGDCGPLYTLPMLSVIPVICESTQSTRSTQSITTSNELYRKASPSTLHRTLRSQLRILIRSISSYALRPVPQV